MQFAQRIKYFNRRSPARVRDNPNLSRDTPNNQQLLRAIYARKKIVFQLQINDENF